MNYHRKPERRTFLQDRFEILIKRQRTGKATFNELTELDEIVNADPEIRNKIISEGMLMGEIDEFNGPANDLEIEDKPIVKLPWYRNLLNRIKSLILRIFISQIVVLRTENLIIVA